MYIRQGISIGNLLLDLSNYRHGRQESQKGARDAIISEQGRKLVKLAEDILEHGVNPFDLPMVVDAEDGLQNFIVVEGNRRLTAIMLMLDPELAAGTALYRAFLKLHKNNADAIPKVLDCVIAPNKASARTWIDRKHANGLEGAGTEHWSAMAKARADVDNGIARPDLDIVNFVLTNPKVDQQLREELEGGSFNLSTLQRLVTTKELQNACGFTIDEGKIQSTIEKNWLLGFLTDIVLTISDGKFKNGPRSGKKFTEREVDSDDKRTAFVNDVLTEHPGKKEATKTWNVSGNPKAKSPTTKLAKINSPKGTPSTEDQLNLIPKKFKLELPSGKINDIFIELKKLDATTYRHSVSVLFRVFVEMSLEVYMSKRGLSLPLGKDGKPLADTLANKLKFVIEYLKTNKILNDKELKPLNVAISNINSFISPNTLNAYVHSRWMNPEPLELKLAWANLELFMERLWNSK